MLALYAASMTSVSPWSLASGSGDGDLAVGVSFERAFRL